jgi:mannose-1-phosphate guanylyltransferase
VVVVPGDFGWSDVGSWTSAWELATRDEQQNALFGETVAVDTLGCYVRTTSSGKLVALLGLEDVVVVDTEDALLVMPRSRAQDVRAVVNSLKNGKRTQYL